MLPDVTASVKPQDAEKINIGKAVFKVTMIWSECGIDAEAAPPTSPPVTPPFSCMQLVLATTAKRSNPPKVTPGGGMLMLLAHALNGPYTGARKAIG